jgi:hypothetical protein
MNIVVVGYPRSGTTWLCRLLGDVLNSPVDGRDGKTAMAKEGLDRTGPHRIYQEHRVTQPKTHDFPVFIIRDPRDVTISVWQYWERESIDEALEIVGMGKHPLTYGWRRFNAVWRARRWHFVEVRYEDLHKHPKKTIEKVLYNLGDVSAENDIDKVIKRQSFANRVTIAETHGDDYAFGKDIQRKHLFRGKIGTWKEYFTPEHKQKAEMLFGDWMLMLGYTDSPDWWRE